MRLKVAEAPPSFPARVVQVFVSPGRLFAALRDEPRWLMALLLGTLLAAASSAVIPGEIWNEMIRRQMLEAGRTVPEGLDFASVPMRIGSIVAVGIFWPIWTVVTAGIVTFVFGLLLGDDGRFRQYLSVTAHGLLIAGIGGILTVPLRILQRDPQLTLNLGLFVPLERGYLHNLLTMLDLFLVWSYIVIAVGIHEIDPRRSWGSATSVMLGFALVVAALVAFIPR